MVRRRAEACWKMLTEPKNTCMPNVDAVFFKDCLDRYFTGSLETPSAQAPELGEGMEDCESPSVARVFQLAEQRCAARAAPAKQAAERSPALQCHVAGVQLGGSDVRFVRVNAWCLWWGLLPGQGA